MKENLTIVKVGGKIVEEEASLQKLLEEFTAVEGPKVLIHGGGRTATALAAKMGIETRMVDGRRITDEDMLRVVTMVYAGLVNKNVVAKLQSLGVKALGLTGADMDVIRSHRRPVKEIDYGFVGDVDNVDGEALSVLIDRNFVPVMAPLTHDGKGQLLNTNADTIAGEVAKALASYYQVTLIYCFEKKGVLANPDDDDSVIPLITPQKYESLKEQQVIQGGMIPKLDNSFAAMRAGVDKVIITRVGQIGKDGGTTILNYEVQ